MVPYLCLPYAQCTTLQNQAKMSQNTSYSLIVSIKSQIHFPLSLLSNFQMVTIHLIALDADWWNSLPVNEQVIRANEQLRVLPPSCLLD